MEQKMIYTPINQYLSFMIRYVILNQSLNLSSHILNMVLRRGWFKLANRIVIFRKKHIVSRMLKYHNK
jgi:hypothetical protein